MSSPHRQPVVLVVPGGRSAGPGHGQTRRADPERRAVLADFAPVPHARLPCPSIVAGSGNDPYRPARLSRSGAAAHAGRAGHRPSGGVKGTQTSSGPSACAAASTTARVRVGAKDSMNAWT